MGWVMVRREMRRPSGFHSFCLLNARTIAHARCDRFGVRHEGGWGIPFRYCCVCVYWLERHSLVFWAVSSVGIPIFSVIRLS